MKHRYIANNVRSEPDRPEKEFADNKVMLLESRYLVSISAIEGTSKDSQRLQLIQAGEYVRWDGHDLVGRQISALQIESELLFFRKNYGLAAAAAGAALSVAADAIIVFKRLARLRFPLGLVQCAKHARLVLSLFARTRSGLHPTR